jgi:hypothetical protein
MARLRRPDLAGRGTTGGSRQPGCDIVDSPTGVTTEARYLGSSALSLGGLLHAQRPDLRGCSTPHGEDNLGKRPFFLNTFSLVAFL